LIAHVIVCWFIGLPCWYFIFEVGSRNEFKKLVQYRLINLGYLGYTVVLLVFCNVKISKNSPVPLKIPVVDSDIALCYSVINVYLKCRTKGIQMLEGSYLKVPTIKQCSSRAYSANYRAKKKGKRGRVAGEHVQHQYIVQGGKCIHCEGYLDPNAPMKWEIDHLIPMSGIGENDVSNIVISCTKCNRRKGEMPLEKWVRACAARGYFHRYAFQFSDLAVQLKLALDFGQTVEVKVRRKAA
jgi:hypothetical protein